MVLDCINSRSLPSLSYFGTYHINELAYTKYGCRLGLKPKFRPLALLDMSAFAFIRGIWAYAISTKISCTGPYDAAHSTCEHQVIYELPQCGILTSVDSDEPLQPPLKLRNSK